MAYKVGFFSGTNWGKLESVGFLRKNCYFDILYTEFKPFFGALKGRLDQRKK